MDLNRVFLYGNLTRDPETRNTQSGAQVTNFSIAVNERRGREESTMFIKIETWNKTAELCDRYLRKGSGVLIEGRLKIDEYETRDGQKRRDPVVVADRVSFGPKSSNSGGGGGGNYGGGRSSRDDYGDSSSSRDSYDEPSGSSHGGGTTEDDLPF